MPYDDDLKGALFRNENKKSEGSPDYSGNISVNDGDKYRVAGWVNTSKAGKKYLALRLTYIPPEDREPSEQQPSQQELSLDDVPF